MAVVPDDDVDDIHVCASDGIALRMCEDNTSHTVEIPKLHLYPPDYKPLPIEECFKECDVFMLEFSCGHVDKHPKFVPPGMTRDCAVAVVLYTFDNNMDKQKNIYKKVNSCLYWRRPEEVNQWKHYIWHLVKGIRLLDKVTTTVYRGIDKNNFCIDLHNKTGNKIVWNSITSCSQRETLAKSLMKGPQQGVFFFIKVSYGHKLGKLSIFPQEQEVLLEPGSEFVVTGSVCFNETLVVYLEQIPSTNLIVPLSLSEEFDVVVSTTIFTQIPHLVHLDTDINRKAFSKLFPFGTARVCAASVRLYTLAAQNGHSGAQFHLGVCYQNGVGVVKDDKEAVRLYTLAAQQGHSGAQNNLGVCYSNGDGVVKDFKEAVRLYILAAQQGDSEAQHNLGLCHLFGEGVVKDNKEAVRLLALAAQQGNTAAQLNLGVCYQNGDGVVKDSKEAVRLFTLAAQQGDSEAQNNLGWCYQCGDGVVKDNKEAVRFFTLAAQHGHSGAQHNLLVVKSSM